MTPVLALWASVFKVLSTIGAVLRTTVEISPSNKGRFFNMALFTESKFPLQPYGRPEGVDPLAQPQYLNDAITLQMADGTVTTVFDTLETGLKALNYLRTHGQYSCLASDDVIVVSINGFRGLVMEQSLINQKLLHSFVPIDMGGAVRWVARTTSLVLDTGDALSSVGACVMTPPQSN